MILFLDAEYTFQANFSYEKHLFTLYLTTIISSCFISDMADDKIKSPEEQRGIGDDTSSGEKKLNYKYFPL